MLRALALLLLIAPTAAHSAQSQSVATEGGEVRLVVSGDRDGSGSLRGAVVIDLLPGWKTYWRDPGDAGIPPTIEISGDGVTGAAFRFPAPQRFDDGTSVWAGYDRPVALPVHFELEAGATPSRLDAHVFLGICQDICIPVDARFSVPLDDTDEPKVDAAFDGLPEPAGEDGGVSAARREGKSVTVDVAGTADPNRTLFVAAPPGWTFSPPLPSQDGRRFSFDILFHPKRDEPGGQIIPYTLVEGEKSVEGRFDLP